MSQIGRVVKVAQEPVQPSLFDGDCPMCNGTGTYRGPFEPWKAWPWPNPQPCPNCGGSGTPTIPF